MAAKHASETLLNLARNRRTIYAINKTLPSGVTNAHINDVVKQAFKTVPSSFNTQTTRAVVLFNADHDRLWDITSATLKKIVPAEKFQATADRIGGFKGGAGTVLFFVDEDSVTKAQENSPLYADRFPNWSAQSAGMHQYLIWTALEADGLAANLQHYNPLIDDEVKQVWNVPANWRLDAQLVFGGKVSDPAPIEKLPIDDLVKTHGA